MKISWFALAALACSLLVGCQGSEKLELADGTKLLISKVKQPYVAVSFWASWCTSCREEVESMNQLSSRFNKNLLVLGVNFDEEKGKKLIHAIHDLKIAYPVVVSDITTKWGLITPEVLPTTYLLKPNHQIIKTFYGENTAQQLTAWMLAH